MLIDRTSSVQCSDGKSYDITSDLVTVKPITRTEYSESSFISLCPRVKLIMQCVNSRPTSLNHHSVSAVSSIHSWNTLTGLENRTKLVL